MRFDSMHSGEKAQNLTEGEDRRHGRAAAPWPRC